jgi:UDP-2,3-diacylglucosamine pyrophosphatase LpxH
LLDDFPHAEFLAELVRSYGSEAFGSVAVDLVFNGDTFDLLKTSVNGSYPVRVTAEVALAKLERVLAAHAPFFDALAEVLQAPRRRVFFITGNHDAELVFPEVQRRLRERLGDPDHLYFPGYAVAIGDALVEHGSQADGMFRVPPSDPLLVHEGQAMLRQPWGAVALLEVAMPMQAQLHWADRLKPRSRVFELLPELREVLVNAFWSYYTRDYLRDLFQGDPVKQLSWTMFREVLYRFGSQDPDINLGDVHQRRLQRDPRFRVRCIGHHHQPLWWTWSDRKLLVTGCFRDEFAVDAEGRIDPTPLPKVYAEIYQRQGRTVRSHLVEIDGPEAQPGAVPADLASCKGIVAGLLGPAEERDESKRERELREQAEARETEE